jgi:branched-chain amino acid transport system substrate-binding protein
MVSAINLFMDEIRHEIAGRKVELIIEDDQYSVAHALDVMRKLVDQDKVHMLLGTISSNIAYGIAPSVDAMRVPMILPITGADDLTKRTRHHWIVRTGFSSSQYGHPFAEYIRKHLGYSRIATFGLDFALGWELVGSFHKTFAELGGEIVQKLWDSQNLVDFSMSMRRLSNTCDAVFFATANLGADRVATGYKQFGPKLPMIGAGPGFDETVLLDVGYDVLGAISVSHHAAALKTPENLHFVQEYRQRYGEQAATSLFAEGTYTAGLWLKKAIEAIDGDVEDKPKLLEALKSVELLDAPRGPMKLDAYGNPIQNIYIRRVERVAGVLQNTVIHTFPRVSQFWNYDPGTYMKEPAYSRDYRPK